MATPFVLLTSKIAQFREDFHLVVVRVEIFGGEPLAAPWASQATPLQLQAADPPIRRYADTATFVVAASPRWDLCGLLCNLLLLPIEPDTNKSLGGSSFLDSSALINLNGCGPKPRMLSGRPD
jgi:hypothetical protein